MNLIGDHTDYNEGLVLPMAIDLGVTAELVPDDGSVLTVMSTEFGEGVEIEPGTSHDPAELRSFEPAWARLVATMVDLSGWKTGGSLRLTSSVPVGAGLSSSAALTVALAAVFGITGSALDIAQLCQEAEHRCGVPVGLMDPLASAAGRKGHALLIDCSTMRCADVPLPEDARFVVADSGQHRELVTSPYSDRVNQCRRAALELGPLGLASDTDLERIGDPVLLRRARHVISECRRVRSCADALRGGDLAAAGALMTESHRSLADDFEVSTPEIDALVDRLCATAGIYGARMTGAGFGGCVVALARPGSVDTAELTGRGIGVRCWEVSAVDGMLSAAGRN